MKDNKDLSNEELEEISGGFGRRRPPYVIDEKVVCPYCGTMNHAYYKIQGSQETDPDHDKCLGRCIGILDKGCEGVLYFSMKDFKIYFKNGID